MMSHAPDLGAGRHGPTARSRDELIAAVGMEVVQFQEMSAAFDEIAARILALERDDLPCMTMLLFGGPASVDRLTAVLHRPRSAVAATVGRLELAGYARRRPDRSTSAVELTEHAREWIERIWAPLRRDGVRLLRAYSSRELKKLHRFLAGAREVQERQVQRLRTWLERPSSSRRSHMRGGLSPAALRRVQLFVEANLERPITLRDLAARAELSLHHFARAFRTTAGVTPRAFVEQRRLERAKQLLERSDETLAAISLQCGFVTQSRLTTTFRRRTGFTPAAYRRGRRRRRALATDDPAS